MPEKKKTKQKERREDILKGVPTSIEAVKKRLVSLRTKYKDVPEIRYPKLALAEVRSLERRLRAAGITYIGKPPRLQRAKRK